MQICNMGCNFRLNMVIFKGLLRTIMDINDKNIIITGASSGIGAKLLEILVTYKNVKIVAVARHIESIPIKNHIVFPFEADVSTKEGVDSVFAYANLIFGNTDIFIANAGFAYLEELKFADWEHMESIFNLNVFSPIYSLEKLIGNATARTVFVSTISAVAIFPLPYYSLYCSTKSALHQFFETYQYEKKKNIQIIRVYPVATKTEFFDKAGGEDKIPLPSIHQYPLTVAKAIVNGIEKNKKRVYPSLIFRLFYPITRAFPFIIKLYSLNEKRKIEVWMNKQKRNSN